MLLKLIFLHTETDIFCNQIVFKLVIETLCRLNRFSLEDVLQATDGY